VVLAVEEDEPVGVVHPVLLGREVELGAEGLVVTIETLMGGSNRARAENQA
jgi:hypothetical protein